MTAQLFGSVGADSLLYSFTPAAVARGGSPVTPSSTAPPSPLTGARRLRAQSVPGEPTHRVEEEADELHTDHLQPGSPRAAAPSSLCTSAVLGSLAMSAKPSIMGFGRCGSADRNGAQSHSPNSSLASLNLAGLGSLAAHATAAACGGGVGGSGAGVGVAGISGGPIPVIAGGGGSGGGGLPPMRHSISGNPGVGFRKLDLPAIAFGGGGGNGGGGGPLDLPGLGSSGSGRRSLSGGFSDAASVSAFLDMPLPTAPPAFDGSAPPSPSRGGVPAVLAPLRVSGVFAASGGAAFISSSSAGTAGEASASSGGGGWCSGSGGGSYTSSSSRRYTSSVVPLETGGLPFSPGPLLPCASEGGVVVSPLTPNQPSSSSGPPPPPRRSHSLSSKSPAGGRRILQGDGGGAVAASDGERIPEAPAAAADSDRGGGSSSSTAVKALYDINDDMQRASAALLALHAPSARPRLPPPPPSGPALAAVAAAAAQPPPPPSPLTVSQLAALKQSAPELQWELRVAVRQVFQVLRQELTATPAGRQLGGTMHECWATLDGYLEGSTELTCSLVEGARGAREAPTAPAAAAAAAAAATAGPRPPAGGDDGGAASALEAQREVDRLRTDNGELRRQLEECRARLARAEAAAAAAAPSLSGAAAGGARGGGGAAAAGNGSGSGSSPRPPATSAAAPMNRSCGTSPRRGKHALVQSLREDPASAADGSAAAAAASSTAPSAAESAATAGSGGGGGGGDASGPRRFDRSAILARGASTEEMVIDEDGSDDSDLPDDSYEARRHMLTYHSASFAEWVRGARRR